MWQNLATRTHRPKLIFEVDDNLWDIDYRSQRAHEFFGDKTVIANLDANIRAADAVTVTTQPLADLVRPLNPNVHVIPNYLPAWLFARSAPAGSSSDGADPPRTAWTGRSAASR
jgi:hypothetical protein